MKSLHRGIFLAICQLIWTLESSYLNSTGQFFGWTHLADLHHQWETTICNHLLAAAPTYERSALWGCDSQFISFYLLTFEGFCYKEQNMCLTVWYFFHPFLGAAIKLSLGSLWCVGYYELLVFVRPTAALSAVLSNTSEQIRKTLLTLGMLGRNDDLDRQNENRENILLRERCWLQRTTSMFIMHLSFSCPSLPFWEYSTVLASCE